MACLWLELSCMEKNKGRKAGFSLVDVLVSFTVTAALVFGLAQLTFHAVCTKRLSDLRLTAAELASEKLEYLRSSFYEQHAFDEESGQNEVRPDGQAETFVIRWGIASESPRLIRIVVECQARNLAQRKTRLVLFVHRGLGF